MQADGDAIARNKTNTEHVTKKLPHGDIFFPESHTYQTPRMLKEN